MSEQQAYEVREFAGDKWASASSIVSRPIPVPKKGETLVQVYLRPVNPTDVILLQTGYGGVVPLPGIVGSEGVAKVVKNGPGASKFQEGQRVIAVPWPQFQGEGTWQQYVSLPEENLWLVPDSIDDKTAAAAWINPVTIVSQLRELAIPEGEWLCQTVATSVLGRQMIALAKHKGLKTVNIVRRQEAKQEILDIGGDAVIDSSTEDVAARIKEVTGGKGAYACIDPIGGKLTQALVSGLRPGGRYLVYGSLDPSPLQVNHMDILGEGKQVGGFIIYTWIERPDKREIVDEALDLLAKKIIAPSHGKSYPLSQAQDVITESLRVARGGKLYLEG